VNPASYESHSSAAGRAIAWWAKQPGPIGSRGCRRRPRRTRQTAGALAAIDASAGPRNRAIQACWRRGVALPPGAGTVGGQADAKAKWM
jgi:hypothetical protein